MSSVNLREKSYALIKKKIVECTYPPGAFIKESDLVDELGVSRTPIREALNMLEQNRLVKIIPRRGVLVLDIDYKEINDIFQVRLTIEPYIIQTYQDALDHSVLQEFKRQFELAVVEGERGKLYQLDDEFHKYLRTPCPNRYFHNLLETIYEQNQRLRILSGTVQSRLENSVYEHLQIINALLSGHTEQAVQLLEGHIRKAKLTAIQRLMEGAESPF